MCQNFKCNLAFPDQIKMIRFASLPKKAKVLLKPDVRGTAGQQVNIVGFQALAEGMLSDDPSKVFHTESPGREAACATAEPLRDVSPFAVDCNL
jgi:hypothetical protein